MSTDEVQLLRGNPDQEHRHEETEVADTIDHERLFAGLGIGPVAEPETNQEVRRQSHTFPAHKEHRIAATQHEEQHEGHKEIEIRKVPGVAGILAHVAHRKQMDERTNTGDDQHHQDGQLIELQAPIDHQISDGHPLAVAHDVQRLIRSAEHVAEQHDGDRKGRQNNPGSNEGHQRVTGR